MCMSPRNHKVSSSNAMFHQILSGLKCKLSQLLVTVKKKKKCIEHSRINPEYQIVEL